MNVINKLLKFSIFLLTILVFFNSPSIVNAESDLTIPKWLIESEIDKSGNLTIVEDITFKFNDSFNGVFREIILDGTDGIEDVKVSEISSNEEIDYTLVYDAENGDTNVFMLIDDENKINIKIFSPSEKEEKTFRIRYTVKNVAVKYLDTAELYYKFLGEENETHIGFFQVNLKLNIAENTKAFVHGPINDIIDTSKGNAITVSANNIPSKTFFEVRALFPRDYIPNSTNVVDKTAYDEIVDAELSYIEKVKADEIKQAKRKTIFNNISFISSIILAIFIFVLFKRYRRKDIYKYMDNNYIDDNTPAVASFVLYGSTNKSAFMATIFDLARKGYISFEDSEEENADNFKLTKFNKPTDNLLRHEKYLLKWLFEEIGNGKTVSTKEIEFYNKTNSSDFQKSYSKWSELVKIQAKEMGYFDDSTKPAGKFLLVISFVFFLLFIFSIVFKAIYGGILVSCMFIVSLIYSIVLLNRKSDYGYMQTIEYKELKKDLQKRSKSLDIKELKISLDRALIYGLALGVEFNHLQKLKTVYPQSHMPAYWAYWFFLTNSKGQSAFENSINKSFPQNNNFTGTGGGFTPGGGAGGGGAGGF